MSKKTWRRPSEKSIRQLAKALGIAGWNTRPVEEVYKAVNNWLLGSLGRRSCSAQSPCYAKSHTESAAQSEHFFHQENHMDITRQRALTSYRSAYEATEAANRLKNVAFIDHGRDSLYFTCTRSFVCDCINAGRNLEVLADYEED